MLRRREKEREGQQRETRRISPAARIRSAFCDGRTIVRHPPPRAQLFKRIVAMRGPSHKRDSDWLKTEALFAGSKYPDRDDRDEGDADDDGAGASNAKKKSGKGPKKKK